MKSFNLMLGIVLTAVLLSGCAVMSPELRHEALGSVPFSEMVNHADRYKGRTVILGGYVVSVVNRKNETRIVAVEAPLGVGEEPKSKDLTAGRLILIYNGFIDPEVYTKDRKITVGGKILSGSATDQTVGYPYLKIQVEEIHLWPVAVAPTPGPWWYDGWYSPFYPWGWYGSYWGWGDPFWYAPYPYRYRLHYYRRGKAAARHRSTIRQTPRVQQSTSNVKKVTPKVRDPKTYEKTK